MHLWEGRTADVFGVRIQAGLGTYHTYIGRCLPLLNKKGGERLGGLGKKCHFVLSNHLTI